MHHKYYNETVQDTIIEEYRNIANNLVSVSIILLTILFDWFNFNLIFIPVASMKNIIKCIFPSSFKHLQRQQ